MDNGIEECWWGRFLNENYITDMGITLANQERTSYIDKEEERTRTTNVAKRDCADFSNYRPGI